MRKIILLTIVLFQWTIVFGQKQGEGKSNWSPWQKVSPCFPNLYISYISYGWDDSVRQYLYNYKLKNTSSNYLHFNLDLRFSSGADYTADGRFDLSPGTEKTNTSMYYKIKPDLQISSFFILKVTKYIENNGKDDWSIPSYSCENEAKICDNNCSNNSSTTPDIKQSNSSNLSKNNIDEQITTLTSRRNELCLQVENIDNYNTVCNDRRGENRISTKEILLENLKEDIRKLELRINSKNSVSSSSIPSSIPNNSKDYDSQIYNLLQEKNKICKETVKSNSGCNTSLCLKKESDYMTHLAGSETQIENKKIEIIEELNRDITELKVACDEAKSINTTKQADEKTEPEQKEKSKKELQELIEKVPQKEKALSVSKEENKEGKTKLNNNVHSENQSKNDNDVAIKTNIEIKPRVQKKSDDVDVNYDRSSLYTLMITNSTRDYEDDIKSYFENKLTPDKYNDHNLDDRFITSAFKKNDQLDNIVDYLNENKVAQKLVAKWFNRSEKGGFNIDLIRQRGYYDASASEINQAKYAKRGIAQLINPEVVKKLIDNTFILVIDSKYTNKEKVASVGKSFLSLLGNLPGSSLTTQLTSLGGGLVLDTFGKGFWVSTNAHLFKLVWDDEIATQFDNELWCDDKNVTPEKRKAFDNADFFALEYIGTDQTGADIQSTGFTTKTNGELVGRATVKSIEHVITKLQENYDVFKSKTPIYTTEPLTAKIGLKEGVTKKTKFEILEQQLNDEGTLEFVRVGSLKVDSNYQIWDNRYGADEENPNQGTDKTYFKAVSGKDFAPGMLLRQIK